MASACPRAEQNWRSLEQEPGSAAAAAGDVLPHGAARAAETPELNSSSDKIRGNGDICL